MNSRLRPGLGGRAWRWAGLALVSAASAGCALFAPVPPESAQRAPLEVPAAWSQSAEPAGTQATAAAPAALADWWRRFDEPLLAELVERALRANPRVDAAQAALRQARALRDGAAAAGLPRIDGSATLQRSRAGNDSASSRVAASLDASWELDLFGQRASAVEGRQATLRARTAALADTRVSIAAEVALALIDLRSAQIRLAIADTNAASQQETSQLTQWRLQAGLASALEADQARAALEQTRAQRPAFEAAASRAAHALAVLCGEPPAALNELLATSARLPQAPSGLALSLPAQTLRQRPDLRAAEAEVDAALAGVAEADAARKPSLRLSGTLGLNALGFSGLGSGAAVAASVLAGLAAPLFDGGAGVAQVRAQQGAFDIARSNYRGVLLGALQEVEDALAGLRADRERLARLREAGAAAGSAALLARQRYGSGLIDFQVVLETQRSLLAAQDSEAAARAEVSRDHVRLYKALGGGWQSDAIDSASLPVGTAR